MAISFYILRAVLILRLLWSPELVILCCKMADLRREGRGGRTLVKAARRNGIASLSSRTETLDRRRKLRRRAGPRDLRVSIDEGPR